MWKHSVFIFKGHVNACDVLRRIPLLQLSSPNRSPSVTHNLHQHLLFDVTYRVSQESLYGDYNHVTGKRHIYL